MTVFQLLRHFALCVVVLSITGFAGFAGADEAEDPIPYPANTCLVADMELGSMGEPYVFTHAGYEIKFCCQGCMPAFENDTEGYMEKLKALHAAAEDDEEAAKPYPSELCLVSDERLGSMGDPMVFEHEGYEIKLCCGGCRRSFANDTDTYMAKLAELHDGAEHEESDGNGDDHDHDDENGHHHDHGDENGHHHHD
ncbi:MAG: hypothetical protein EA401_06430 [Planctomycetota bacterium]|nr:MAG: hypothetical protein EA401_06430 [Planctomycetota bacterium]